MTGTISVPPEAREYIEEVRAQLADLTAEDRDELLADVEVSVQEAAAESPASIAVRLGPPAAFAAELRSAAGLPPVAPPAPGAPGQSGLARLREAAVRVSGDPRVRRLRELAPIWWVVRAYVAVAALALLTGGGFLDSQPLVPWPTGGPGSLLLLPATVVASVWIGLLRRGGRALVIANAVLALAALWVGVHLLENARGYTVVNTFVPPEATLPTEPISHEGVPVRNIYAFDREGRMLFDVLLYDQEGKPLDLVDEPGTDPLRRPVIARNGRQVFNAFPIRYFEPGTRRVARPRAAPRITPPKIVTPPPTGRPRSR